MATLGRHGFVLKGEGVMCKSNCDVMMTTVVYSGSSYSRAR